MVIEELKLSEDTGSVEPLVLQMCYLNAFYTDKISADHLSSQCICIFQAQDVLTSHVTQILKPYFQGSLGL